MKCSVVETHYEEFLALKEYQKAVKQIANDYGCLFIPLQDMLSKAAETFGADKLLLDGVHPTEIGAKQIAEEWLKYFKEI